MTSTKPQRYFGLHMVAGTAEYQEPGSEPYRIYLGEETIKNMDASFTGCPVYVHHVDNVDYKDVSKADGLVVRSFYNKLDGKHWAEFIIMTDEGHAAIRNGWKLSNAYIPKSFGDGGLNHGVEFSKEVTMGEYEHLAIVPNPRYEESIILTPEQFKSYNDVKELELKKVANSKGDKEMKWNLFKKSKVENATDIEGMSVTLPTSKVDKTVSECLEIADKFLNMHGYANVDHMVKVGEEEMSVNDLVKKHMEMSNKMAEGEKVKENAEGEDGGEPMKNKEELDLAEKKANEEKMEKEKKENEEKMAKEAKDKEMKKNNFEALKNAHNKKEEEVAPIDLSMDKLARGKAKYGSGN